MLTIRVLATDHAISPFRPGVIRDKRTHGS